MMVSSAVRSRRLPLQVHGSMFSVCAGLSHVGLASWVHLKVLQWPGGRGGGRSYWTDAPELHTLVQLGGCKSLVCLVGSETTETVTA